MVAELRKSLYVDDLVSGKPTVQQAKVLKDGAIGIFNDATMTLHKWHSNQRELEDIVIDSEEKTFAKEQLGTPSEGDANILGLAWSKDKDELKFVVPESEVLSTKRGILSRLAQIFGPLGLLSPRTLQGKIIYREVCQKKVPWDAPLSSEQKNHWLKWVTQLPNGVAVPRSIPMFQENIDLWYHTRHRNGKGETSKTRFDHTKVGAGLGAHGLQPVRQRTKCSKWISSSRCVRLA